MQLKSRTIALPLAAILASGALFSVTPAEAKPRSKDYKTGAIALGALGAYLLSRGKTVAGAAVIGGGVLAYNKGEQLRKQDRYGSYYDPRYRGSNTRDRNRNNGGYTNGSYSNWNQGAGDYRYDNASVQPDNGNAGCADANQSQDAQDWNWGQGDGAQRDR